MAQINLLPWRETRRQEQQKQFLSMIAAAALVGVALVAGAHFFVAKLQANQQHRNQVLENEIQIVNKKIKEIKRLEKLKQDLLDRMEIIQQLQQSRPEAVHLFDELVTTLPDGVYLTELTQKGDTFKIQGKAESDARVSTYMRNLDKSPWLKDPTLDVIETQSKDKKGGASNLRNFSLSVKKESPATSEDNVP
ncbi:MAG: PilN domain-containing protein [Thiotrichales bacterium]